MKTVTPLYICHIDKQNVKDGFVFSNNLFGKVIKVLNFLFQIP